MGPISLSTKDLRGPLFYKEDLCKTDYSMTISHTYIKCFDNIYSSFSSFHLAIPLISSSQCLLLITCLLLLFCCFDDPLSSIEIAYIDAALFPGAWSPN